MAIWSPVGMQRRSKMRTVQSLLAVAIMLGSAGLQWMEFTCSLCSRHMPMMWARLARAQLMGA